MGTSRQRSASRIPDTPLNHPGGHLRLRRIPTPTDRNQQDQPNRLHSLPSCESHPGTRRRSISCRTKSLLSPISRRLLSPLLLHSPLLIEESEIRLELTLQTQKLRVGSRRSRSNQTYI